MEMALAFNNVQLVPVLHNNQPWIRATELARALGYKDESSVRRIYERNSDEFSSDMTQVIEITETVNLTAPASGGNSDDGNGRIPGLRIMARIFSLRGCHLLAMFARTPVAKSFRRWVLDVLDKLAEQERARLAEPVGNPDRLTSPDNLSTTASRKPLRALVHAWAQISGTPHTALWPQVKAHFQLTRIDDLPESWIPDALEWVQAKIDQCGKALPPSTPSTDKESLTVAPAAPGFREDLPADMDAGRKDALRKIRSIMESMLAAREVVRMFCYPQPVSMNRPRIERLTHSARHDFYAAALDCLSAAHEALEVGYKLGRLHGRG